MTLKTGDIIQNRYRIVRLVGQGGFGAVYRAWDMNVSQPIALKENLGVGAEAQRQFEREATLLAGPPHPNCSLLARPRYHRCVSPPLRNHHRGQP